MSVSHVYIEPYPLARSLPAYLCRCVERRLARLGVEQASERLVTALAESSCTTTAASAAAAVGTAGSDDDGDADGGAGDGGGGCDGYNGEGHRGVTVSLAGWEKEDLRTDYVVFASTHIDPANSIAVRGGILGLETDAGETSSAGGIVVNGHFEAANGLYVAGNAASYYDAALRRRRLDGWPDHAVASGAAAGRNMAGRRPELYAHEPAFRSDLSGIGVVVDGVGEVDAALQTVGVFMAVGSNSNSSSSSSSRGGSGGGGGGDGSDGSDGGGGGSGGGSDGGDASVDDVDEYERGIVYYLRDGIVVGAALWNCGEHLERARALVRERLPVFSPTDLKHTISIAPDRWVDVIVQNE